MVMLHDILDSELLQSHIGNGYVSARPHNTLPLEIFNYTPKAQYERVWDDVTKKCRGLIWNYETGEVVARPFEKFYNWDESGAPFPPTGPALRMPKMDGSLGILYHYKFPDSESYRSAVATRGSMHSEQAEWASKFFTKAFVFGEAVDFVPNLEKTYLFEIIYPENRIVVDYGDYEGLVLIDVIDIATGLSDTDEFDNCAWPDKVVRKPVAGFDSGQDQDIPHGDEGFVYLWPARNFRTKMKAAEYVRIHRLVSGLTAKSIWQHMVGGGKVEDLKRDLPEEFHKFIDDEAGKINESVADILYKVYFAVEDLEQRLGERIDMVDRKTAALAITQHYKHLSKYLFLVLDGKHVAPVALYNSKPQREVAAVQEV